MVHVCEHIQTNTLPLYNGKSDKYECSHSRGITLLRVVCKLYGRVLIKRVRARIECA